MSQNHSSKKLITSKSKTIPCILKLFQCCGSVKMTVSIYGLIVAGILLFLYLRRSKRKALNGKVLKDIPGPWGLPIVGNALQLSSQPNNEYSKWTKEYGDVYQVNLGGNILIMVSDPKMAKEVLSDTATTGRPHFLEMFDMYPGYPPLGMFFSEGELWEVHRRFLLRKLRDRGFGKTSMEGLILEDVNQVLSRFRKQNGKPIGKIRDSLKLALVSSLWQLIASKKFEHDDPELRDLVWRTTEALDEVVKSGLILLYMPFLRHIFPKATGFNTIMEVQKERNDFFTNEVEYHKRTLDADNPRDFIDEYLIEMKNTTDPSSVFYGDIAEKNLTVSIGDLFAAGADTTATTIDWAILYLAKFPEVQKKMQKEIGEITGENSRKVTSDDKPNMPYVTAVIDEVLRHSSIVAEGDHHRLLEDREYRGYYFPKNAWVQTNLHFMHHNPKLWGDPENFRPERFLSTDGKKFQKSDNMQAFNVGKRQCPGEILARNSIFLYLTHIFQTFDVRLNPNEPEPGLEYGLGFIRPPKSPYTVIMSERK